ncbi:MAG: GDP-mannose mannosyl hydrolase [Lentisphaerae bacterium ADurb.Bin242]|nr:MAG: GDP-mannose mannosyl hydrolase [Lentisphaerae bacterium ADurb.Bin242]
MCIEETVEELEKYLADPAKGLPEEIFLLVTRLTPMVNVDLWIRDATGRILFTWRNDVHHGQGWHIPGGIIRFHETIRARITAVASGELNSTVRVIGEPLAMNEFIVPGQRNRSHFLAFLYLCELTAPLPESLKYREGEPVRGQYAWFDNIPEKLLPAHEPYRPLFERHFSAREIK